jgi:hypothetical protein
MLSPEFIIDISHESGRTRRSPRPFRRARFKIEMTDITARAGTASSSGSPQRTIEGSGIASARARRYAAAVLTGLAVGFAFFVLTSNGLRTVNGGRLGGDFPAFYSAGRILNSGGSHLLYDAAAQQRAQQDLLPGTPAGWLPFAYPPYVAIAFRPFAALPFTLAYVLYTLAMAACTAGAVLLLSRAAPWCRTNRQFWLAAALTFYPLFRAIVGGQNTAASLLCAAGATAALCRGRHSIAGAWLGVWLFKPQLALVATTVIVAGGHAAVLPVFLAVAAGLYLTGAWIGGAAWPLWWYRDGIAGFLPANLAIDGQHAVSIREFAFRVGYPEAAMAATILVSAVACLVIVLRRPGPLELGGAATAIALLVSPHSMYYDGGLIFIALAVVSRGRLPATLVLLASGFLFVPVLASSPLSPLSAATLWLALLAVACLRSDAEPLGEKPGSRHGASPVLSLLRPSRRPAPDPDLRECPR